MASNLNGLGKYCSKINQSGIIKLEYAAITDIDRSAWSPLRSSNNNHSTDIVFNSGGWHAIKILPTKKIWRETPRSTKQGITYDQSIRAILPGLQPSASGELERTATHRFILRINDISGQPWILGSPERPFSFQCTGTTGENGSLKHHVIEFSAISLRKAAGFIPVM